MSQKSSVVARVWQRLEGTWNLTRKLHSINAAEPSGNCKGTATFTIRQPAIFVDDDGALQNASKEMLYSEQGEFEMSTTDSSVSVPRFTFSRKYVWRLQQDKSANSEITIWFVKPGTDQIDYLFHKFLLQHVTKTSRDGKTCSSIECSGGHLCVEDYYSSTYIFHLQEESAESSSLQEWDMVHEVRGPKKDQLIETSFSRV